MNIQEIRELIRMRPPELHAADRRLAHCHDIADLRRAARRLIPRPVFDYVDGGSDEELSLAGNVEAFRRWRFVPRALANVAEVDTAGQVLGHPVPLPLVLAPTGYTRIMHPGGEIAAARAAARHGLPYTLSTMANTSIADLATAVHGDLWFQLYILTDGGLTRELVDRAAACGYRVLVVTVDTMVTGRRIRDVRNGLTLPPELTVRTVASIGSRPEYWLRMLRSPGANLANLPVRERVTIAGTGSFFHPGIDWGDIAALREQWPGKLVIKGPLGAADARRPSRPVWTACSCPTTAGASSTAPSHPSTCCPGSGTRSARTSRCSSTPVSGTAPTSPSPWRSAPMRSRSAAPTCTA